MDFLKRAMELEGMLLKDRRFLHENAEAGLELPVSTEYIKNRLKEIGLEPVELIKSGLVAAIGGKKPGKTILLRADFDALPMAENNELPFKTKTNAAHMCGHDMHASMLLGAAQILKEYEDELEGTVKLMFQPAEEIFAGARAMINAGVLKNPDVDAAFAIHMCMDEGVGTIKYGSGYISSSCDGFKITIHGKGCHGAMPELGVDPINVGVHIHLALQALISREAPPYETAVLTIGQFTSGSANNIIPATAVLQGTLRTYNVKLREKLARRLREVSELTAKTFNATIEYEVLSDVPPAYSNPQQLSEMIGYIDKLGYDFKKIDNYKVIPSDDIACISEKVPFNYLNLCCNPSENSAPLHNPNCLFDESAMPLGAAVHAQCAYFWLKNNK